VVVASRIRAFALVALCTTLPLAGRADALPVASVTQGAAPRCKLAPLRRAFLRELASWRSMFRRPARMVHVGLSSGASIGAGYLTLHLTGSSSAAAFASFTTGVVADRIADKLMPRSRLVGGGRPPPFWRDATQTLVGATVSAAATPLMLSAFEPLTHIGANAPGVFGLGAQLLLSRPIVQGLGSFTASMLAQGARAGFSRLFSIRSTDDR